MNQAGSPRAPRMESVRRPEGVEMCPYCERRMYDVPFKEHPDLEVHVCFACGGCVIYEVADSHAPGIGR